MSETTPVLSAGEILKATGGSLIRGSSQWLCRGLSIDTRTLRPGNLFVALKGERFDGHDYLTAAAERGASGFLIRDDRLEKRETAVALPLIAVRDTLQALGDIASAWRRRFTVPLVAITGSCGKTTTKEMLAAIVGSSRQALVTEGNLNNQIGLPLTLLRLQENHDVAIVEMGTNQPGEIARLAAIAAPDIGLITNIGPAHLEGLKSFDGVREEKGALFQIMNGRGTAILNHDDEAIGVLARRWQGSRITFGFSAGADVTARKIAMETLAGVRFRLVIAGSEVSIRLAIPGRHNILNALAASSAAWALGMAKEEIASGLGAFRSVPGRMEILRLGNGAFMIMDAYNANPASMRESLATLRELGRKGRTIAILGDMLELGEQADQWHEETGAVLARTDVALVFFKGLLSRSMAAGALKEGFPKERISFFDDPAELITPLRAFLKKDDWILLKGSRKMKMEQAAERIISTFDLKP
jgi:UDP-N-acetylmuramoyl-tripeptide--D-alanyl-D-alanine ligase